MIDIPATNEITQYMHCQLCLEEKPADIAPREWARTQAGFTKLGMQVWCVRHDVNICHMDFQGKSPFPANVDRLL